MKSPLKIAAIGSLAALLSQPAAAETARYTRDQIAACVAQTQDIRNGVGIFFMDPVTTIRTNTTSKEVSLELLPESADDVYFAITDQNGDLQPDKAKINQNQETALENLEPSIRSLISQVFSEGLATAMAACSGPNYNPTAFTTHQKIKFDKEHGRSLKAIKDFLGKE